MQVTRVVNWKNVNEVAEKSGRDVVELRAAYAKTLEPDYDGDFLQVTYDDKQESQR